MSLVDIPSVKIVKQTEGGYIQVVGTAWYPIETIRKDYFLSLEDVESIRLLEKNWFEAEKAELTERAIHLWITRNCGEFQKVTDYSYHFMRFTTESTAHKEFDNEVSSSVALDG